LSSPAPFAIHEPHLPLTGERLEAFGQEIEAIRERVVRTLGERDARHILAILALQRRSEIAGRALLFAGVFPPAFAGGVALLALSKILETMEIGHNVIHGQYDWMNDPALHGANYEWDWACPAAHWRASHNHVHHTFANIVGKDRDVGYGLLRMADEQPWIPANALQPVYALLQALSFEWAVAVHHLAFNEVLRGEKSLARLWEESKPVLRKVWRQGFKDFIAFPLLAGPSAPVVLAGNLGANLIRNVWAFAVIFCGHFPTGVRMFRPEECQGESRAAWYLRQILGSANIEGSRALHVLSGHLSHQIEHHVFPDLPAPRYPEIAHELRALCTRYGVPYNSARFARQLGGALWRIVRCAVPSRPAAAPKARVKGNGKAKGDALGLFTFRNRASSAA
jgi:NADPH-dependent stearoyl-CoA 9-desaturase